LGRQFIEENPKFGPFQTDRYCFEPDGPGNGTSWYIAAAFCNWLSSKEGLSECYEPNGQGEYAEGMKIRADALQRTGYRLPTEAEWEYACRAGASTSRYYGESARLLASYAWHSRSSDDHSWPCGSRLPNDIGLFDTLGNIQEWCMEKEGPYPKGDGAVIDRIDASEEVRGLELRMIRGGAFRVHASEIRSALRYSSPPATTSYFVGFRLARTLP
jgi:formylglycine-generating enzyme required for sulfatase activity